MKFKSLINRLLIMTILILITSCGRSLYNVKALKEIEGISSSEEASNEANWSKHVLGGNLGFGVDSFGDLKTTSLDFGAEYLISLFLNEDEGAGYIGATANYQTVSSDNFDENIFRIGPKLSYFDKVTKSNEVQLVYGVSAYYETGNREFSGSKDDISGYGAYAFIGANFNVNNKFSIGVEAPVFSWSNRTFSSGSGEFEVDNTFLGINKNNILMAYLRIGL